MFYDNLFITLKARKLKVRKPEDLKGLSVIAFQGALRRYPEWLGPVVEAGNYHEQPDQETQVLTLHKGRHDVVLRDRNIFKYFALKLKKERHLKQRSVGGARLRQAEPQRLPADLPR